MVITSLFIVYFRDIEREVGNMGLKHDTRLYFGEHEVDFSKIREVMSDEEVISLSEMLDRMYDIVDNLDDIIRTMERFIKC